MVELSLLQFERLKLPRNNLTEFPPVLKCLPNLRTLSLSINTITQFPLFEMPITLVTLRMCHNLLTSSGFPEVSLESINRSFDLWTPPAGAGVPVWESQAKPRDAPQPNIEGDGLGDARSMGDG